MFNDTGSLRTPSPSTEKHSGVKWHNDQDNITLLHNNLASLCNNIKAAHVG